MTKSILITSFDVWKPHHISNASDDLLQHLLERNALGKHVHLLRKLPVHFELAPQKAIAEIERLQPDVVICCGMAERRSRLSIESNGKYEEEILRTVIDAHHLIRGLSCTRVSHSAGRFVCNHLYYSVLKYLQQHPDRHCIFVHVPVLHDENLEPIVKDFLYILEKMSALV